ncbi:Protein RMD5-like [Gracilariopsis chorda]|uniref:Protein RMD5-like n=1 Tax=Gracilariopsis chorda TaxID=448386 RepID=A0A2V3IHQ4_9FLOR|nr:Protein RMD5-like [Gracilariopsis chorda]|eukprot:PXF41624.1 Protein RMD5-like [Gracilariopsis chorda]
MESILNEYAVMLKRRQKATRSAETALDSMLSTIRSMRDALQQPNGNSHPTHIHPVKEEPELQESPSDPHAMQIEPSAANTNITTTTSESDTPSIVMHRLQQLHCATKSLQASLLTDHKSVGAAINKFGRTIDAATSTTLADLCAPSVRLNTCKINEAIATHLFREGLFDVGRNFLLEASVLLDDSHIQPFEQLYHILTAFRNHNLTPAIQWAQSNHQLLKQSNSHLEFRLHRLAYLNLLQQNRRSEALKYAQRHFRNFQNHINSVQKLMTCLLYAPNLSKSPYKNLVSPSHKEHIERSLSREYCRAQGLPRDSLLVTVVHCGTKAIPMLLKAAKLAPNLRELGMDDALPVEVDVGRHCQFHSIFTCPVSKEEAYEGNNAPMILPCGHVLSKQSITRLPRGSPRFKCPYCPMEQNAKECHELRF